MKSRFLRLLGHILSALVLVALMSALALAQDAGTAPPVTPDSPPLPGWLSTALPLIGLIVWEAWLGATKLIKPNSTIGIVWAVVMGIWDAARKNKQAAAGALLFLFTSGGVLYGCAHINPVLCGAGKQIVPPDVGACAAAFLEAAKSVPGDIAACRVEPTSAACIDAVLSSVGDLAPCMPTCAPIPAAGRSVASGEVFPVSKSIQRANVIQSLRATGHANAGK